jgi:two-component system, sensor histidine kinase
METPQSRAAAPRTDALAGEVVVILEDDELVRRATERLLRRFGAEVVGARSSGEALKQLSCRGLLATAVVADYWLNHEESGLAAVGSLRTAISPVLRGIIVSGDVSQETARAVTLAGFRLLRKPVDVDSFIDVLMRPD